MSDGRLPDRRDFLALGLGAFAFAALPGPLRARRRVVRRTVPIMGTVAELAVVDRSDAHAHRALDAAVAELRRIESLMTRFREDSDIGRANLAAARRAVPISSDTAEVLRRALTWARASDGAFDPCLGRAVEAWDVGHRRVPLDPAERAALALPRLWASLEVDTGRSVPRVRFGDPAVSLDLGGIAKGYGVDAAGRALRDHGVFHGLVNVGGDLVALGASGNGDPWRIGVRSPDDPRRVAATLEVTDGAIATSGDYLRFFEHGGRRYHHLMDPRSGEPRETAMRTLTVIAGSCLDADAGATAVFGMDPARARRTLRAVSPEAAVVHTDLTASS